MLNQSGLKVTGDKVLIRPMKVEEKTSGGIVLPKAAQDKEQMAMQMGTLVDWGSSAIGSPELDGIKLGDLVIFPRYQGQDFPVDGERYWVLRASSILGKATKMPDWALNAAQSSVEVFGTGSYKAA
jgi:chaperonin GroES